MESSDAGEGVQASALATLPFSKLAENLRKHFEELSVRQLVPTLPGYEVDRALPSLAHLLRNLKFVRLSECRLSDEPQAHRLMFVSLAALPHLAKLTLPTCQCLDHIDAMAQSGLKYLTIDARGQTDDRGVLSEQGAMGVSQLQQIERFVFVDCAFPAVPGDQHEDDGGLALLLDNLPPSSKWLQFQKTNGRGVKTIIDLHLRAGRFWSIALTKEPLSSAFTLLECAGYARPLLSCCAMGPTLDGLFLRAVVLQRPGELDEPGAAPLRQLLQRSTHSLVGIIIAPSSEAALSFMQSVKRVLGLDLPGRLRIALWKLNEPEVAGGGRQAAQAQGTAGAAPASQPPPAIPPASELLHGALQRLTSGPVADDRAVAQPPRRRLVLLRGSLVAGLAATPDALLSWVRALGRKAAAAAGADTSGGARFFDAYQVLPAAGAVIAASSMGLHPAAAVAAAVAGVTARAGAAGAVVVDAVSEAFESQRSLGAAYRTALQQEVQAAWDRLKGSCGGARSAEVALLPGLLGRWEELSADTPPEVKLL